ncbi:LOW QUALITY PROTEIN: hypothetical protein OSB04_029188 [Centaurea solstitialis]|uniref:Uncharacterized protein n=1 Tax=Centaurea solstitialis TaxID=347529 RepID=A0AA38T0R1_9ASTR|nr:LOW QUALITY PROTEIN: hypothetical protein OSB04_029188 [Centaurea solstitialis]
MYSRLIKEVPGAQPYCVGSSSQIKVSRGASKQEEKVESEAGANKEAKSFQASREAFRIVTNVVGIIPENVSRDISSNGQGRHQAKLNGDRQRIQTQTRTTRVRCVPIRTDDRPVAFISMMIMEERIIIGRLQGCPRPEELCSLWNTVVGLTLSVHFVVIRVNFASEQLADVIAREAVSRHGGASDSYFRSGYPHHVMSLREISRNLLTLFGTAYHPQMNGQCQTTTCIWRTCYEHVFETLGQQGHNPYAKVKPVRENWEVQDWKTTLDSSEQTKSYADRRRSGSEVPSEKACPFEGFTMEGSNLFPLREPGLCRKNDCYTRKEHEEATKQENRNH